MNLVKIASRVAMGPSDDVTNATGVFTFRGFGAHDDTFSFEGTFDWNGSQFEMKADLGLEQLEGPVKDAGWEYGVDEFLIGPFLAISVPAENAVEAHGEDPGEGGAYKWSVVFKNGQVAEVRDSEGSVK